ncbi:MAG: alpha/beta fold hydrolase [Rhizobiaceae bacterium]
MSGFRTDLIDGLEFGLRDGDRKKCVVMLHGIGSNFHTFDRLARHLPDDWMLLAWNAPGYGQSEPLAAERPVAKDYSARLHHLVRSLNLSEFALVGHSLGTIMAVDYACRFPRDVRHLTLMACAEGYGMGNEEPLPEKAAARLADLSAVGAKKFAEQRAPRLLFEPDTKPDIRDEAIAAMSAIKLPGYAQAVHLLASGTLSRSSRSVRCPSLVVVGAEDVITPPSQSEQVHQSLIDDDDRYQHRYRVVSEAGHLVHKERPEIVASEITTFVNNRKLERVVS